MKTEIRFHSFPLTEPPPRFANKIIDVFRAQESGISTIELKTGLTSDGTLAVLAPI